MPYIIDALLEGSANEVRRFAETMDWLHAARMRHSNEGSFSRLVVEIDRAALASYLASSKTDRKSRCAVLALLQEIWGAFSNSETNLRTSFPLFFSLRLSICNDNNHFPRLALNFRI